MRKKNKVAETKKIIQQAIESAGPYSEGELDEDAILEAKELEIAGNALKKLFKECVTKPPLHLGLARYLLRRASSLRTRAILELSVENLPMLTPVFRELILYWDKVWSDQSKHIVSAPLFNFPLRKDHRKVGSRLFGIGPYGLRRKETACLRGGQQLLLMSQKQCFVSGIKASCWRESSAMSIGFGKRKETWMNCGAMWIVGRFFGQVPSCHEMNEELGWNRWSNLLTLSTFVTSDSEIC